MNGNVVVSERELTMLYLHRRLDDREAQVHILQAELENARQELARLKPHVPTEVLQAFDNPPESDKVNGPNAEAQQDGPSAT